MKIIEKFETGEYQWESLTLKITGYNFSEIIIENQISFTITLIIIVFTSLSGVLIWVRASLAIFALAFNEGVSPVAVSLQKDVPPAGSPEADRILTGA